jgi:hypothetical protein
MESLVVNESQSSMPAWLNRIRSVFVKNKAQPELRQEDSAEEVCCSGSVHIAYRGVSDDRLYLAHARKWGDVRFFRPRGLKVFCADCRRRLF